MQSRQPERASRLKPGFYRLGGKALFLGPAEIDLGKREPARDVARVLSGYNDMIMARLFDHAQILELAEYADIPVINGLTDYNHPCQIMADILTIKENRGHLDDLKVAYIGDGNNIVHSWLRLAGRLAHVSGRGLSGKPHAGQRNRKIAQDAGLSTIEVIRAPDIAATDADVVYTDVWASMGQKHELETRKKQFRGYTVTPAIMAMAKPTAVFMHCLPPCAAWK